MADSIFKKNILVTGAGGSIGGELCKQIISRKPNRIVLLDVSEYSIYRVTRELEPLIQNAEIIPIIGSVQNRRLLGNIFKNFSIDTVYHAAAYKHVPLMEQNIIECVNNNVFGTFNLIEFTVRARVQKFVLISSDKAVNPTNVMGASKRLAEMICQNYCSFMDIGENQTKIAIVRFGNVLGSSGSVIPLFKKQIADGGPVTVTSTKVTRYFMTIQEAAQLVLQAASLSAINDMFVLEMGKPVKIIELAKKMITLSGREVIGNDQTKTNANQIQIVVTGLRPGEKMHEELTYNKALKQTKHQNIYTTDEPTIEHGSLKALLDEIRIACDNYDHKSLLLVFNKHFKDTTSAEKSIDLFHSRRLKRQPDYN